MRLSKKDRTDFLQKVCDYLSKKEGCHCTPFSSGRALQITYKGCSYKIKLLIDAERNRIDLSNVVNGMKQEATGFPYTSLDHMEKIFSFLELIHNSAVLKSQENNWYQ